MAVNFKHNITSDFQMFFPQAGSCQMEGIVALYNYIMTYLVGILFVVTGALVFIIIVHLHGQRHINQFRNEKNLDELIYWIKYLQKWTHSTILELVWTIIPTIILIAIAVPSFILLYSLDEIVDTQCVVKIIAYQWYWRYEYPVLDPLTEDIFTFSYLSYMLPLDDLTEEDNLRLLEVDTPLVLPINVNAKLIITSKDVIHSFAVPALGIKMDAVPGRLNQVTVHIFKPGVYYGQCSELCGVNHAFMPIVINAVDFVTFESFLTQAVEIAHKKYFIGFTDIHIACWIAELYDLKIMYAALIDNEESIKSLISSAQYREELLNRLYKTLELRLHKKDYSIDTFLLLELYQEIFESEKILLSAHTNLNEYLVNHGIGSWINGEKKFLTPLPFEVDKEHPISDNIARLARSLANITLPDFDHKFLDDMDNNVNSTELTTLTDSIEKISTTIEESKDLESNSLESQNVVVSDNSENN